METVRQAEDWMRRASALLAQAERLNLNHPDTLSNCREAFVLYARAAYLLLDLEFPEALVDTVADTQTETGPGLGREAARLGTAPLPLLFPYTRDLPRLIVLAVFWSTYASSAGAARQEADIRPGTLFGKPEAGCAVSQARQCHTVVKSLIDLKKES